MKKILPGIILCLLFVSITSCKQKKKEKTPQEKFFPALDIIRDQVAHVDTSLYSIRKLVYVDSTKTDTVYVRREEFRGLASDFLRLPNLSDPKFEDRYVEENSFDTLLNRAILVLEPKNPDKEEIQRQESLIRPDDEGGKVTSIIIDYLFSTKDSLIQKKLLWQIDKSFQVITTRRLPGQAETTTMTKVIWGDEDEK